MPTGKQPELKPPLDTSSHVVIDINESPPAFGPYQAEYFQSDDGDIVSHDHHLNEDGDYLSSLQSYPSEPYSGQARLSTASCYRTPLRCPHVSFTVQAPIQNDVHGASLVLSVIGQRPTLNITQSPSRISCFVLIYRTT